MTTFSGYCQINKIFDKSKPLVNETCFFSIPTSRFITNFTVLLCRLEDDATNLPDVVLDDDGLPIAELDGSVPDIFANEDNGAQEPMSDTEEQHQLDFQV